MDVSPLSRGLGNIHGFVLNGRSFDHGWLLPKTKLSPPFPVWGRKRRLRATSILSRAVGGALFPIRVKSFHPPYPPHFPQMQKWYLKLVVHSIRAFRQAQELKHYIPMPSGRSYGDCHLETIERAKLCWGIEKMDCIIAVFGPTLPWASPVVSNDKEDVWSLNK